MRAGQINRGAVRNGIAVACLIAAMTPCLNAEDDPKAAAKARLERIQNLRQQRPDDPLLVFYQALAHINLGERDAAFELLRSLHGRKLGLVPVRAMGFEPVWEDAEFQKIRDALAEEGPNTPAAPVAFRLKDPKLIPEGIAYDAKRDRFFIGSIAQGKIVVTNGKGETRDFSNPGEKLDAVLGLTVDAAKEKLYAVTTNGFLESAKKEKRNAVVEYDLESGRILNRFEAPAAMQLNDLAVAPDATLYVTDSLGGTLFRKKPGETTLTAFGDAGRLPGANGIALARDGTLFVAIATGIARVDPATAEAARMAQPDTVVTGGIDGLAWHDGTLLGVQNVTNPGRVIRITLAETGDRIESITVLQSHDHPDFHEPTTGAVAKDAFYVIGNSFVANYQPDGTIKDPEALKGAAIVAVPLQSP